jgi:hypothetical protein
MNGEKANAIFFEPFRAQMCVKMFLANFVKQKSENVRTQTQKQSFDFN